MLYISLYKLISLKKSIKSVSPVTFVNKPDIVLTL